jgi:tetratricopeptide (TPR) repeat protein
VVRSRGEGTSASDLVTAGSELHDRAIEQQRQGKFRRALVLCRYALRFMERAGGPNDPDVANVGNTLGSIHHQLGNYVEAERLFRRSVDIMENVAGGEDVQTVRVQSFDGLATLFRVEGRYEESENVYRRALAIAEQAFGPEHGEV